MAAVAYWRIQKMPKAPARPGTMSACRVPTQPMLAMMTNDGTVESCDGTIIVARMRMKSGFGPGNRNLAKVKPESEARNMVSTAERLATMAVLANEPQKLIESSIRWTLSSR